MAFAGQDWQPELVIPPVEEMNTSTKPLFVNTDQGEAIVKYMGNPMGNKALIRELICSQLARMIDLTTPDFAIVKIREYPSPNFPFNDSPLKPAFFSRWEQGVVPLAPDSKSLHNLHRDRRRDIAKLVVLDTWICNEDRAYQSHVNRENVLFRGDEKKSELLVIDHTHTLGVMSSDKTLGQWWTEGREIYGFLDQFKPFMHEAHVREALDAVRSIDIEAIRDICKGVPDEWGMDSELSDLLSRCIAERGQKIGDWLPEALADERSYWPHEISSR